MLDAKFEFEFEFEFETESFSKLIEGDKNAIF